MNLLEKLRSLKKEQLLPIILSVGFGIGFISATKTLLDDILETRKLENSDYILKYTDSTLSRLYTYDDNKDGQIDRIEERRVVPFKGGMPAFRIQETYLPSHSGYYWYRDRILALGKPKE